MYLLFRYKNIMPSDYQKIKAGEKRILRVFMIEELEDREREMAGLLGAGDY